MMRIGRRRSARLASALGVLAGIGLLIGAVQASVEDQRDEFLEAESALAQGRIQDFERLSAGLEAYPLFPYLEYARLSRDLAAATPARVGRFLDEHRDTPLAGRLRTRWLDRLAEDGRWQTWLQFYAPSERTVTRCQHLQALIATGQSAEAYEQVPELWLHGGSQPAQCDPVFDAWRGAGRLTPELTWRRVELAFEADEPGVASYLKRYLRGADQGWVDLWLRVHRDPALVQRSPGLFGADHAMRNAVLEHGLRRLARQDAGAALGAWQQLQQRFPFSGEHSDRIRRHLVLQLARRQPAEALAYFDELAPAGDDAAFSETRIRTALELGDWPRTLRWIDALGEAARGEERWRYWRARALEQLGRGKEAEPIFRALSGERSYYGFLAADRLGQAYRLEHIPVPLNATVAAEVQRHPALLRARELLALDRLADARREWQWATGSMSTDELQAAAKLAQGWGWHDRAIFTLARTGYWDDLELRFPLEHRRLVERLARGAGLDPAWVYAVVRQESAFVPDARSSAGALGLMQLMPETARHVARKLGEQPPAEQALLDPGTNIRLGSTYLSGVLGELDDHPVLATAAYNAGPGRVRAWLPETALEADLWVELIPFRETRTYVQRVLTYTVIYEQRLGDTPTRLRERMRPVNGPSAWAVGGKDTDKGRA